MDAIELVRKEGVRRGYSFRTINTYIFSLKKFLKFYKGDIRKIGKKDVKAYLNYLISRNVCGSSLNVNLCALKFLMRDILNKSFVFKIKFSKIPKKLPIVLSKEEVFNLIDSVKNKKHKLVVKLMYGAGLRVSEVVNLKVKDLEGDYGWVRNGKGGKDRLFLIPNSLREELMEFTKEENLDSWIFKGRIDRISVRSVQEIVKKACKKIKIKKRVSCHTLRHSFSTHLIENGYDVASVQTLLGHSSMNTTMVYVHIAKPKLINVKSPLDSLGVSSEYRKYDYEDKNFEDRESVNKEF